MPPDTPDGEAPAAAGGVVWVDGELVGPDARRVSPFDHGLTVGDGVFETLQVVRGTPFAIRRHLARLRRSAAGLGLEIPRADDDLRAALRTVADASGLERARLRLTVTGGIGPLGSERGEAGPTVVVAAGPLTAWTPTTAVTTVAWTRNEHGALAGLKTTSYAENVVALAYVHERGGSEAILANTRGDLCEGTGTNVFVVVDDTLVTPPLAAGCLAGITRELVIEAMAALGPGHAVREIDLPLAALAAASEAFLTSSTRDVQAIHAVDDAPLAGAPGPHTRRAAAALAALMANDLDP